MLVSEEMQVKENSENTLQVIQIRFIIYYNYSVPYIQLDIIEDIETLVPMNAAGDAPAISSSTTTEVPTTTSKATTIPETDVPTEFVEETTPVQRTTTTPYDPAAFYHTVPVPKKRTKEKYLTFCTKDLAIRDSDNMIVACGDTIEVWYPPRCQGTSCFYTEDSTFRICCPVFDGQITTFPLGQKRVYFNKYYKLAYQSFQFSTFAVLLLGSKIVVMWIGGLLAVFAPGIVFRITSVLREGLKMNLNIGGDRH